MSPIGSFEGAWEDYDHADGPALISEGKAWPKAGANAPNWRVVIGSESFSRRFISGEVTFSKTGESGIRFSVPANLRAGGYERARVRMWFGYGTKLVPYFSGRLAEPIDSVSGLRSEASAYGLKTQLGQRYLQNKADYGNEDLRDSVDDLWDRFGALDERLDFWGTHSTTLARDLDVFRLGASLSEIMDTLLEPMQFVSFDNPAGIFTIQRSHLASLGTDEVFSGAGHYWPEHYPKDGFTFDQSQANFFSKVVILRRNEDFQSGGEPGVVGANPDEADSDEYAVFATHDVANPGDFTVNEGRWWILEDYPGQQEHAEREAELVATSLSRGAGHFEWQAPPIDFSIGDHLTVYSHEQTHDPDYVGSKTHFRQSKIDEVGYACVVEEITFPFGAESPRWGPMTISGQAFEISRETIRAMGSPIEIDLAVAPYPEPDVGQVDGDAVVTNDGDAVVTNDGDRVVTNI